jgi:cbb3-type cytochrome oxidase subunit 3
MLKRISKYVDPHSTAGQIILLYFGICFGAVVLGIWWRSVDKRKQANLEKSNKL